MSQTVLKRIHFMAVIDGMLCPDARSSDIQTGDSISRHVRVEWDRVHLHTSETTARDRTK